MWRFFLNNTPISKAKFMVWMLCLWPTITFAQADDWWVMPLMTPAGESHSPASLVGEKGIILFFMDPDCPVTQKYGATIRELYHTYREKGIAMAAIYPVINADPEKIRAFAKDYRFPFSHLLDPKLKFTQAIEASITPEVFLLDAGGNILYQGAIDNWFYELGRYRRVITEHYLKDALKAHLQGKSIVIKKTDAVGCMIGTGMLHDSDHH